MLAELDQPLPLDGKKIAAVDINDEQQIPDGLPVGYAGYGAKHHGVSITTTLKTLNRILCLKSHIF